MDERKVETPGEKARTTSASPAARSNGEPQVRHELPGDGPAVDPYPADDYDRHTESRAERHEPRPGNGHDSVSHRSPVALMRHLVADVALLFRKEVALAAAEVNQSVHGATTAAGSMLGGGAILHAGIIFLLAAAVIGLAQVMALWLATLIVGGVVTLIGIIMVQAGKKKLQPASFKPERTADSLRKDKEALRRHKP